MVLFFFLTILYKKSSKRSVVRSLFFQAHQTHMTQDSKLIQATEFQVMIQLLLPSCDDGVFQMTAYGVYGF